LSGGTGTNKYLYNSKELQDDFGLYWYDYGARMYDAELGRWHTLDPLAEKYNQFSPYVYVADNPMKYVDPNGKEILIVTKRDQDGNISESLKYSEGKLFSNGKEYSGKNSFALKIQNTLNNLYKVDNKEVNKAISALEISHHLHYIENSPSDASNTNPTAIDLDAVNQGASSGSHVVVSLNGNDIENGLHTSNETTLGHELKHSFDFDQGNMKGEKGVQPSAKDPAEQRAVKFENLIRSFYNIQLRKTYGGEPVK
jgi:RHS repeat-associated protein